MKTYSKILLVLILILDICTIIGILNYNTSYHDTLFVVFWANLILGPAQFIPALVLFFTAQIRSALLVAYILISIALLSLTFFFIYQMNINDYYRDDLMMSMFTCYGLAHFYPIIIHSVYPKKISFLI